MRERASRRAVKQRLDEPTAEARARAAAAQLVNWYHESVELPILESARLGKGRRMRVLDTTRIEVEQGYQQLKSGGWKLQKLSITRDDQIVFYRHRMRLQFVSSVFADETREAITLDQWRNQRGRGL